MGIFNKLLKIFESEEVKALKALKKELPKGNPGATGARIERKLRNWLDSANNQDDEQNVRQGSAYVKLGPIIQPMGYDAISHDWMGRTTYHVRWSDLSSSWEYTPTPPPKRGPGRMYG